MKIRIDWRKSVQENASECYALSKELARKEEGAKKAIAETQELIGKAERETERAAGEEKKAPKMKRRREWFEKYKWFFTSGGKLVVAGRDAKQNDNLVAHVMKDDDLFFHADIQGAPATILVGGKGAGALEKKEAAQFAASHSSAWKTGAAAVDVYAVSKSQLSKHAQGGYVAAGGFAIAGGREWFRSTPLGLAVIAEEGDALCLPIIHPKAKNALRAATLLPAGKSEKGETAKRIAENLGVDNDNALLALPSGRFAIRWSLRMSGKVSLSDSFEAKKE